MLELRSRNDIELHVEEVEKKGTRIEKGNNGYNIPGFDHFKSKILARFRRVKYKDLPDVVFRMELTYDENVDILDTKYFAGSTVGYTLPPGINEFSDLNMILHSLLPDDIKVVTTTDDIRLRSNLGTNKTIRLTRESFFYTVRGLIHSHSSPLNDPPKRHIQRIPRT